MNKRLKEIIFKKLYDDLSQVEIISFRGSIWFINRQKKYWYFEYTKIGLLWWRFDFFNIFFDLFSLERKEYEMVMSEWVEEVLNCKVDRNTDALGCSETEVEEVLDYKINKQDSHSFGLKADVEEVLNHKVVSTEGLDYQHNEQLEDVLNNKVDRTMGIKYSYKTKVEEVLNHKVVTTEPQLYDLLSRVNDVLDTNG